jgi:hypothetical protein
MLWNAVESFVDHLAHTRFRGHKDPVKHTKSLKARDTFLGTCKTAYTATFALPLEITNPQHLIDLSERIVTQCYVQKGLITDFAIHLDKGNPHLHILAVTRPWVKGPLVEVSQVGFSQEGAIQCGSQPCGFSKSQLVIEKEQLVEIRKLAAEIANEFAREKGYTYLLDARSYAERGIALLPTRHLGQKAYHTSQEKGRIAHENKEIHEKNLLILFNQPEELIKLVATKKVVFTKADIEREIFKRVGGDMTLYSLLKTRLEGMEISPEMVSTANDNVHETLRVGDESLKPQAQETVSAFASLLLEEGNAIEAGTTLKGASVFTTQQAIELEKSVKSVVQSLGSLKGKEISSDSKEAAIAHAETQNGFVFSEEQKQAIEYLVEPTALRVLTGKAGTGKTTVLKPVVDAYREAGYIPIGAAFQGKVSELLAYELGIPSYTLDQLRHYWGQYDALQNKLPALKGKALKVATREIEKLSSYQLTPRHVVILDEGNMVAGNLWEDLLLRIQTSGAHLRVVQDTNQIKALYGADISRLVEEEAGSFEITEVHRQQEDWMRKASAHLNTHDLIEGIKPYEDHGCLTFKDSTDSTRYAITEAYVNALKSHPQELHVALAYRTQDVSDINAAIHHQLQQSGVLGESLTYQGRDYAVGDQIVFTENDHTGRHVKLIDSKRNLWKD